MFNFLTWTADKGLQKLKNARVLKMKVARLQRLFYQQNK